MTKESPKKPGSTEEFDDKQAALAAGEEKPAQVDPLKRFRGTPYFIAALTARNAKTTSELEGALKAVLFFYSVQKRPAPEDIMEACITVSTGGSPKDIARKVEDALASLLSD